MNDGHTADDIRDRRGDVGVSQKILEDLAELPRGTVKDVEVGRRPEALALRNISLALGCLQPAPGDYSIRPVVTATTAGVVARSITAMGRQNTTKAAWMAAFWRALVAEIGAGARRGPDGYDAFMEHVAEFATTDEVGAVDAEIVGLIQSRGANQDDRYAFLRPDDYADPSSAVDEARAARETVRAAIATPTAETLGPLDPKPTSLAECQQRAAECLRAADEHGPDGDAGLSDWLRAQADAWIRLAGTFTTPTPPRWSLGEVTMRPVAEDQLRAFYNGGTA